MSDKKRSALTTRELAALDLSITVMQQAGHTLDDQVASSNNPHEMMAEAWADLHHPLVDISERDREIIAQIKELAGQLSSETTLADLVEARGRIISGQ
ncbi:hypothetical protein ACWDTI_13220 [Gordonia sp. NPDC003424]